MHKSIRVGVENWCDFPVEKGFYPDDLPPEWELSYFANEFESACIAVNDSLDLDQLEEWGEDLCDDFQLSIKLTRNGRLAELTQWLKRSNLNVTYLLLAQSLTENVLPSGIVSTPTGIVNADGKAPCLISSDAMWTPDNQLESSAIALFPDIDDKRSYRDWIELWLNNNNQTNLTLWLNGQSTRYTNLSRLRTLVELMGL